MSLKYEPSSEQNKQDAGRISGAAEERSPGSAEILRRGGRRPLLSEGGSLLPRQGRDGWIVESIKLTGR